MNPSTRGAIVYEAESLWAEDVTTFATFRLPVLGTVDPSGLKHEKVTPDRVVQRRNDGSQWILATQGGTFKTKLYLTGHGTSTSGATTLTSTETLLGRVIGNAAAAAASGSTFTGAGTATAPTTTASATFSPGALCTAGVLGDGRGNGQFYPISTHITTTLTLLGALASAPNAADVLGSSVMIYPSESPLSGPVASNRFLLQGANTQYECHGVFATDVTWSSLKTGGNSVPVCEITWQVSWWRYSTVTFPTVVATDTFQAAANASGSLFIADVGTPTRASNTYQCRDFTLTWKLGVEVFEGPGGVNQYQTVVGARRTADDISWAFTVDADATTTTPVIPGWATSTTPKHACLTLNPTAGKRVGFYAPNLCCDTVPIQMNDGGINRFKFSGKAYTGTDTTSDLSLSATRMAWA